MARDKLKRMCELEVTYPPPTEPNLAARRLFVLLSAIPALASRVAELSSANSAAQRAAALAAFRAGGTPGPDGQATTTTIRFASDDMTRGMDVERVANVVSYDAPAFAKTYVHRAGRTARAGRAGTPLQTELLTPNFQVMGTRAQCC